jgi:hypothetical protein
MSGDSRNMKEIEYYSASVNAWFNTRLEHDKSLLTLSAGGVGLLVSLLTSAGVASAEALVLYVAAIVAFLTSMGCVLFILKKNSVYIEESLQDRSPQSSTVLERLDGVAIYSFAAGVTFTGLIGISAAIASYNTGGSEVTKENGTPQQGRTLDESFQGSAKLRPDEVRSFAGSAALQPAAPPVEQPASSPQSSQQGGTPAQPAAKPAAGE